MTVAYHLFCWLEAIYTWCHVSHAPLDSMLFLPPPWPQKIRKLIHVDLRPIGTRNGKRERRTLTLTLELRARQLQRLVANARVLADRVMCGLLIGCVPAMYLPRVCHT